jgi:preprotein translocase subunit SecY
MTSFWRKFKIAFTDKKLRNKLFFVIFILILFRFLSTIPIPGVNTAALNQFLTNNQFFGILNIFSGGGLSTLSIIMLGVGPFITSSIIMQLLTLMVPRLKVLYSEEGEAGRRKFTQYSRLLTIPLAVIQGLSLLVVLERQGVIEQLTMFAKVTNLSLVVAGSMLLMWLGELVSEYGIGNGVSMIIFAGIVANIPREISQLLFAYDKSQLPIYLLFAVVAVVVIAAVVFLTEAERPVPVTYAKQVRGNKLYGGTSTYIPLRITQAGVIPIIFALSILLFPQLIGNLVSGSSHMWLASLGKKLLTFNNTSLLYGVLYFFLVFVFTYFYTAVTFDPQALSTNLQKNGAFIPGIRPGQPTADYISRVLNRITLIGALFLGFIAVLPLIARALSGITSIALGGTALLIVVSVVIDLLKKIEAQISMREY